MNLLKLTEKITEAIGTIPSLIFHGSVFVAWFVFHWDINLLTNLVSLEAIFLAIFIQMSVNRHHTTSKKTHAKIIKLEKQINDPNQ